MLSAYCLHLLFQGPYSSPLRARTMNLRQRRITRKVTWEGAESEHNRQSGSRVQTMCSGSRQNEGRIHVRNPPQDNHLQSSSPSNQQILIRRSEETSGRHCSLHNNTRAPGVLAATRHAPAQPPPAAATPSLDWGKLPCTIWRFIGNTLQVEHQDPESLFMAISRELNFHTALP